VTARRGEVDSAIEISKLFSCLIRSVRV